MEFEIIIAVMGGLFMLVGGLVFIVVKRKPIPTQVLLQCNAHPTFDSKLQTLEIKVNGLENRISGLSSHITSIENKIDVLLSRKDSNDS